MESMGERIRRIRLERGIKRQQDLAALVGLAQGQVSDIESKGRTVTAENLIALSKALRVSPEYLVSGEEAEMHELEIIRIYRSLPPEQQQTLLTVAKALQPDAANRKLA